MSSKKDNNREKEKIKAAAYRLLKLRLRSKRELQQRLKGRKFSNSLINGVISELEEKGLINDRDFALFWARSRLQRGWAERKIKQELRQKGIEEEIQEEVFEALKKEIKKEEVLRELFERRWQRLKEEDAAKRRRKIFSFFMRRGFSHSEIERIWEQHS